MKKVIITLFIVILSGCGHYIPNRCGEIKKVSFDEAYNYYVQNNDLAALEEMLYYAFPRTERYKKLEETVKKMKSDCPKTDYVNYPNESYSSYDSEDAAYDRMIERGNNLTDKLEKNWDSVGVEELEDYLNDAIDLLD